MSAGRRYTVRYGDRDVAAERVDARQVRVGDTLFTISPCGDGSYLVDDGTRTWQVFVAGPADARAVFVEGRSAVLEIAEAGRARARAGRHGDTAAAPMPGTVLAIAVATGQQVRAGEVLLTLEAMKMELPIRSPRDGVVSAINCAEGELVQPGTVLVEVS